MAEQTLRDDVVPKEDGPLGPSVMRWLDEGGASAPTRLAQRLSQQSMAGAEALPPHRYRCSCKRLFQVYGSGRHRRYYELDDLRWRRPVLTRTCGCCQRQLSGKRRPWPAYSAR